MGAPEPGWVASVRGRASLLRAACASSWVLMSSHVSTFRVSTETALKKTLQELAQKNHRSLTQEIILALEQYVQRETSKQA